MSELDRVRSRYRQRDASATLTGFWTLRNPDVLHALQERERAVLLLLAAGGIDLGDTRVLDVGCGLGLEFASLLRWGAGADGLFGIDLMYERLQAARARSRAALAQASAAALPFPDSTFGLVLQNVVFSSMLDASTRARAAAEMRRVLRPGGWLLWYDAFRTRAQDPDFRPVPRTEVEALFPEVSWHFVTLTSDIGIAARLRRWLGPAAVSMLDMSGIARTHLLGLGQRR